MKKLIYSTLILFSISLFSQNSKLFIYPNFNDCLNCNIGINFLKDINDTFQLCFKIPISQRNFANEMLASYELNKKYDIKYIESKNLKNKTQCSFYYKNRLLDSFPLSEIQDRKIFFSNILKLNQNILNDTLKISDRAIFQLNNFNLIATDYNLNKVIFSSINNKFQNFVIEGKMFNPILFLKLGNIDSLYYYKNFKTLKYIGKTIPHIDLSYLTDSTLYLLLSFSYPEEGLNNTLNVKQKFYVYERNIFTKTKKLKYLKDIELRNITNHTLFLDNLMPFFVKNNNYFFENHNLSDYSKSIWYYSCFKDADTLKYKNSFYRLPIDSNLQLKYKKQISESMVNSNKDFIFFSNFPLFHNTTSNKTYFIESYLKEIEKFYFIDVIENIDNICILLKNSNDYFKIELNKTNFKLINKIKIKINEFENEESIKFINNKSFFVLNKNNIDYRIIEIN